MEWQREHNVVELQKKHLEKKSKHGSHGEIFFRDSNQRFYVKACLAWNLFGKKICRQRKKNNITKKMSIFTHPDVGRNLIFFKSTVHTKFYITMIHQNW